MPIHLGIHRIQFDAPSREQQDKFDPVWQIENAEYLCFSYKNIPEWHPIPDFESSRLSGRWIYVAAIYKRSAISNINPMRATRKVARTIWFYTRWANPRGWPANGISYS